MSKKKTKSSRTESNVASPRKSRPSWVGWIVNTVLLLVSLIIGMFILEAGARYLLPKPPPPEKSVNRFQVEPTANTNMVYRILPDTTFVTFGISYPTNEFGFRDRPLAPKDENTFRILCIGDSVTFGTGVKNEETFPNQLEAMLLERVGDGYSVDVVNAGVSAYNARNVLGLLESHVEEIDPDLVIYTFVENDLDDSMSTGPDQHLVYYDPSKPPDEPHLQREFSAVWWQSKNPPKPGGSSLLRLIETSFSPVSDSSLPFLVGEHPTTRDRWESFERTLLTKKEICGEINAPLLVYSFAAKGHSEPTAKRVDQICRDLKIPHASTLPLFDHKTYMKDYSLGFDAHCNTLGNEVMATRLMHYLQEENVLPEDFFPSLPDPPIYKDEVDETIANELEESALDSPTLIDLSTGEGIQGMLGGVDLAGRMARSCFFRLSPPGDRLEVEMKGLVNSPGNKQRVVAIIEGATAEESYDLPTIWKTYSFSIPESLRDELVEVELKVLGPVWVPSLAERRQGLFPYTAGVRWMKRGS